MQMNDLIGSSGPKNIHNLAAAIGEGDEVKFPLTYRGKDLFSADKVGIVDPDDIEILYKE